MSGAARVVRGHCGPENAVGTAARGFPVWELPKSRWQAVDAAECLLRLPVQLGLLSDSCLDSARLIEVAVIIVSQTQATATPPQHDCTLAFLAFLVASLTCCLGA